MKTQTQPTIKHARAFVDYLSHHGLSEGLGEPETGKMCIEAVWCNILGLPHGDDPGCVGSEVRSFKIRLNDCPWSSNEARAKGMMKVGLAQIGSDSIDQNEFIRLLAFKGLTQVQPFYIRKFVAAYSAKIKEEDREKMLAIANELEAATSQGEVEKVIAKSESESESDE